MYLDELARKRHASRGHWVAACGQNLRSTGHFFPPQLFFDFTNDVKQQNCHTRKRIAR
jgi:hypothetical protein